MQLLWRSWLPVSVLIAALSAAASGSPIQPDLQKLLSKPPAGQERFAPARAGWDGPEADSSAEQSMASLSLERFGPAATAREARASLIAVALPDPKVWACLVLLILLLRTSLPRKISRDGPTPAANTESNEFIGRAA
jgi:hypothetical protein